MNTKTQKYLGAFALLMLVTGAVGVHSAKADTTPETTQATQPGRGMMMARKPRIMGTVTAISGTTLTVTAKQFPMMRERSENPPTTPPAAPATVTYTVDATNATVRKAGATSTVSGIALGDTVMVQGTLSGTNVTATAIEEGFGKGSRDTSKKGEHDGLDLAGLPAGNGQPVIGGSVTAITGSTITVTNTAGVTYIVDATNAKFTKKDAANATVANVSVGDTVVVQGTVNGTAVAATTVLDQGVRPATPAAGTTPQTKGFFGKIGGFFSHIFGF